MGTELDTLIVGNCVLQKEEQDLAFRQDYTAQFELD
jgi:carbamoyltransferase